MAVGALIAFLLVNVLTLAAKARVEKELSSECQDFLYSRMLPKGYEDKDLHFICQSYNKKARYVTLYNTVDRIPVYSAYIFRHSEGEKCINIPWMYEPQLSTYSDTADMQPFPQDYTHMDFEDMQATLEDYNNAIMYERGALNPEVHHYDHDDKSATYTLTNVVPVVSGFISNVWSEQEDIIRKRLNNYCLGRAYIITGVTTSGKYVSRRNMKRIAVPTYLWSAYCCMDYDHSIPYNERYMFPAFAHYALNAESSDVVEVSVQQLREFLKKQMPVDKSFQIFAGDCVSDKI